MKLWKIKTVLFSFLIYTGFEHQLTQLPGPEETFKYSVLTLQALSLSDTTFSCISHEALPYIWLHFFFFNIENATSREGKPQAGRTLLEISLLKVRKGNVILTDPLKQVNVYKFFGVLEYSMKPGQVSISKSMVC